LFNTLTHQIKTHKIDKRKVSMLFLDIEGGVNDHNPTTLCCMLSPKGVNPSLVSWT